MRPDKKKKGRGRYAGKSENAQGKDTPKAEDSKEIGPSESTEPSPTNDSEKTKPAVDDTPSQTKDSNDGVPPPPLRRETDALKETNKTWKRQIFSNWKEYDKPIVSEMDEGEYFHDFASLMQNDVSGDSFFKFKHERLWESDSANFKNDLFNLNLKQLSAGLDCIPLYERLNIPTCLFSEHEVERMNNAAKKQETIYENLLKTVDSNKVDVIEVSNDKSNFKENLEIKAVTELNLKNLEPKTQPQDDYCMDMENVWAMEDNHTCYSENVTDESKSNENIGTEIQPSVTEVTVVVSKDTKLDDKKIISNEVVNNPRQEDVHNVIPIEKKLHANEEKESQETPCKISGTTISSHEAEKVEQASGNSSVECKDDKPDDQMETVVLSSSPKEVRSVFGSSTPGAEARRAARSRRNKDKGQSKTSTPMEEDGVLDSLLSLKEPSISALDAKHVDEGEGETESLTNDLKSIVIHEKKENLEAWLDSMLDD